MSDSDAFPNIAVISSNLSHRLFVIDALREHFQITHHEPPVQWSLLRRSSIVGAVLVASRALDVSLFCTKNQGETRPIWCCVWDPNGWISDPKALLCIDHVRGYWGGDLTLAQLTTFVHQPETEMRVVRRVGFTTRIRRKFRL